LIVLPQLSGANCQKCQLSAELLRSYRSLYAVDAAKKIRQNTGKAISRGNIHLILKTWFYTGAFDGRGRSTPERTQPSSTKR
jgi:hypothetical protein